MERLDRSVSLISSQLVSLPFGIFAVLETIIFGIWHGFETILDASPILLPWYFIPIFFFGIILHEVIHGVTWMIAARLPLSKIRFGIQWKALTPYAHCKVPITKLQYITGTLMPLLLLGVLPFLISLSNGNGWWLVVGVLFTFAAAGDMLIVFLLRDIPWRAMVEDHPERAGCIVSIGPEEK